MSDQPPPRVERIAIAVGIVLSILFAVLELRAWNWFGWFGE